MAFEKRSLTIALAGNPNAGKTTAFNNYTGARQHVANYPGITVDQKKGSLQLDGDTIEMIDLPGTYSLTAYSQEEVVARRTLAEGNPDAVISLLNANALERNLYLVVQLMEMGLPVVVALNMIDEVRSSGLEINHKRLAELLQVPVVTTVARTGEGLSEALQAAVALGKEKRARQDLQDAKDAKAGVEGSNSYGDPLILSYGQDLGEALVKLTAIISENKLLTAKYPARWVALKYLENDAEIKSEGRKISQAVAEQLEKICDTVAKHLSHTLGTYPEAVIADFRYGFITGIMRQGVLVRQKDQASRLNFSDQVDSILTGRFTGIPIMLAILFLIYQVTFTLGQYPADWLEALFGWLHGIADAGMSEGLLKSMVTSGIIDGVGGVLGFVPLILFMFLQLSILEDSGYMARVAYMLDRVFRAFGLHGCSVMPFIISGGIAGGCAVPGIMAARTLRSPRERLATILTAPFMTCGAKVPVFLMLVGAFFEENQAMVMWMITMVGWATALLVSRLLRSTVVRGEATPFVMELPPYRMPTIFGILIHTWERAWQYVKKAGTVILAVSILIWASMTFPQLPDSDAKIFATQKAAIEEKIEALSGKDEAASEEKSEADSMDKAEVASKDSSEEAAKEVSGEAEKEGTATEGDSAEKSTNESDSQVDSLKEELAKLDGQEAAARLEYSIAGRMGRGLEAVSAPAGFDWKTNIALVGGFAAKEVIVSTLGTAYSLATAEDKDAEAEQVKDLISKDPHWNKANAMALIMFVLLYAPCFVTVVVIKQEAGSWKWAIFSVVFNTAIAYGVAVAVYQIGVRLLV